MEGICELDFVQRESRAIIARMRPVRNRGRKQYMLSGVEIIKRSKVGLGEMSSASYF